MPDIRILALAVASGTARVPPHTGHAFYVQPGACSLYAVVTVQHAGDTFRVSAAKTVDGEPARQWDPAWGEISLSWFRVEPARPMYRNGPENPGWWARLDYQETPLDTGWVVPCDVRPTILKGARGHNLGTMRFRLQAVFRGETLRTPGAEAVEKRGISDRVFRLSLARDSSLVGLAYAWFGLPYIYGSASLRDQDPPEAHQAERFIGADCADLMVAVLRRWSGLDLPYRNSAAFHEGGAFEPYLVTLHRGVVLDTVQGVYRDRRGRVVRVGEGGVLPGDFLVYRRHVGMFSRDRPPLGVLDPSDLHIHTCNDEITEDPIGEGFDPPFTIRRLVLPDR